MDDEQSNAGSQWWREPQLAVLLLLILAIYFTRLTTLCIRGEEPHRARLAAEILETGEWIVPKQQGEIYLSRPPLQSWPIAWLGLLRGEVDLFSARFPTVVALLLTAVLLYAYGRSFLSPVAAFAAAVAYATMGQVMEIGRLAETESTFTLLIASSLLLWHWGYSRGWSPALTWSLGYSFSALAGLAKGPQGPAYFAAPVFAYLLIQRDWKYLFSRAHLMGMAAFAIVLGSWQLPFYWRTDWESVRGIWTNNAAKRFTENAPSAVVRHLIEYPLEVLGCMLPWSILLIGFFNRPFRETLRPFRSQLLFALTAIAVTFPTVWFATLARGRYFMPIYPCFAVLVGIVVERLATIAEMRPLWTWYTRGLATVLAVLGIVLVAATFAPVGELALWKQPAWFAIAFLAISLLAVVAAWRVDFLVTNRRLYLSTVGVAILLGLFTTGVRINMLGPMSHDPGIDMAKVKRKLPTDAKMVSLGIMHPAFNYHYGKIVPVIDWPRTASDFPEYAGYFCFRRNTGDPERALPFAWNEVGVVKCDRYVNDKRHALVIVGKVRREPADRTARREPKPVSEPSGN
jgi:4-amino-4-deoxy-L-arabinose transferase-like glycosyltransferase